MAKISRPILYVALLGAVAYAAVVLTEPQPVSKKKATARPNPTAIAADGFTKADYTARYGRYHGPRRDAFLPAIRSARKADALAAAAGSLPPNILGQNWQLTGISSVNGVRSALLENSTTADTVFVKAGERWNGFRVAAIEPTAIVVVNPSGQATRLGFAEPPATDRPLGVAPVVVAVPLPAPPAVPGAPTNTPGTPPTVVRPQIGTQP